MSRRILASGVTALLVTAACSAGSDLTLIDPAAEPSPGRADAEGEATPAAEPVATDATADVESDAGCAAGPGPFTVPDGAVVRPVVDVDGDAVPDRAWIANEGPITRVGIVTAAGGGASIDLASSTTQPRSALVAQATGRPPAQVIVSDGRLASLFVFLDCEIRAVRNREGATYEFSLGVNEFGTGVGCAVVDGRPELVGLNIVDETDSTVTWTRTVIELTGVTAQNGPVDQGQFTKGLDDEAIALLRTVACGSDVIDTFGLTEPRG